MGELARTMFRLSGPDSVHGVIPRALIRSEKAYTGKETPTAAGANANAFDERVGARAQTDGDAGAEAGNGSEPGKQAEATLSETELADLDQNATNSLLSSHGRTTIVPDMHTRKRTMASAVINGGPGSGFVALAGGYGTIEEVMEMVTWNQLGIHACPIVLVNVDGFWDGLVSWVRKSVQEGFVGKGNAGILRVVERPEDVVGALREYRVAEGRYKLQWDMDKS